VSTALIDALVGIVIFVVGISLTVRKFGNHNRVAFAVVAILSPFVSLFAVFRVAYLALRGGLAVGECPPGLEEAERIVERQRQHMFGGPLREPSFTKSWRTAYERELQKDTELVQEVANKYLIVA
jgi:hypothetical protein